jgi:hypothetical protein
MVTALVGLYVKRAEVSPNVMSSSKVVEDKTLKPASLEGAPTLHAVQNVWWNRAVIPELDEHTRD